MMLLRNSLSSLRHFLSIPLLQEVDLCSPPNHEAYFGALAHHIFAQEGIWEKQLSAPRKVNSFLKILTIAFGFKYI